MVRLYRLANVADVLPGTSHVVQIAPDKEVALFNINGVIYALDNICPHQGGPLGEGEVEDYCVICPWHGWTFDVRTGECINLPDEKAMHYPIQIIGDEIFCEIPD